MNRSQTKSAAQWEQWRQSGAVGKIVDMTMRITVLDYAKIFLEAARRKNSDTAFLVKHVVNVSRENLIPLQVLGTSNTELRKLKRIGHKESAKSFLAAARRRNSDSFVFIDSVQREVRAGRFHLEEVGTSNEELAELKRIGYLNAAKDQLTAARRHPNDAHSFVNGVRFFLGQGNLSLADIGETDESLNALIPQKVAS
jgi:hypothetical protein